MALFSRKKKDTASKKTDAAKSETGKAVASAAKSTETNTNLKIRSQRPVLLGPRVTEKALLQNDKGVYVFEVDVRATKPEIKQAIKRIYNVAPVDVRVVNLPGKVKRRGTKMGRTTKTRKAYVQLPAGQTIELV